MIHLKTDSQELYEYTLNEVLLNDNKRYTIEYHTNNLYTSDYEGDAKLTQTFYEKIFLGEGKPITYIKFIIH